jgi:hypothetical protein
LLFWPLATPATTRVAGASDGSVTNEIVGMRTPMQ